MELIFMNWQDVKAYLKQDDRVVIPIGSTEQHGPRTVFGTDHLISQAIARKAAEIEKVITIPALPFGMSIHHLEFPGSITLLPGTFMKVLRDIIWSLQSEGFKRFVILNGHGGNRASGEAALAEICNEFLHIRVKFINWWDIPEVDHYIRNKFGDREGNHSTPSETSLMLYLYPDTLVEKRVEYRPVVRKDYFVNRGEFKRIYPDGVIGADVNLASREHGKRLFELAVNGLQHILRNWE